MEVKPNANNVAGLQLSDLLAQSFRANRARHQGHPPPGNFDGQIATLRGFEVFPLESLTDLPDDPQWGP
jgi:hypothetical protein